MRVLGLDPASRSFGWTCGAGDRVPDCGAWDIPSVSFEAGGADYGQLLSTLKTYLDVAFRTYPDIGAVGYESPLLIKQRRDKNGESLYGDTLAKLRLLYPLGAFVEWYCRDIAHVPCHEIGVQEAKTEITGNRNAEKEDIALIAEKCGLVLPKGKPQRHDASDSWAVWKRLLRYYDPNLSAAWDKKIHTPRGALL
jgi:hypothetical protein